MNAVIVDDEKNALNFLKDKLKSLGCVDVVAEFTDACQALAYLLKYPCDVLFTDIDMPNISGLYIAEQIIGLYPDTKICFVTAFDEYAVKAFELSAIDYILKPYTEERLSNCLSRLSDAKTVKKSLEVLNEEYKYDLDVVCGYDDENIVLIHYDEIFYLESTHGEVKIHTVDKVYVGNKTLAFYESKLGNKSFFRVHKSFLVNLTKADRFKPCISYTYNMYFKGIKDSIPVSRSKVKELKLVLNQ